MLRALFSGVQPSSSNYPAGLPGVGMFLLRLVIGTMLVRDTGSQLCMAGSEFTSGSLRTVVVLTVAALLATGALTPVIATAVALGECAAAICCLYPLPGSLGPCSSGFVGAGIALALSFIGPGAYSIDARIFGWQRIEIPRPGRFD